MLIRHLKRIRMEFDFRHSPLPPATLPDGFCWRAWGARWLREHSTVKYASFHKELDSFVFASLASQAGCDMLMRGIVGHPDFLPQATWLIEAAGTDITGPVACGTIQGLACNTSMGGIQNVGVIPAYRSLGLGRALVLKSLAGFRFYGLSRVCLEVTAENVPAVELYHSIGFRSVRTTFRELSEPIEMSALEPQSDHSGPGIRHS